MVKRLQSRIISNHNTLHLRLHWDFGLTLENRTDGGTRKQDTALQVSSTTQIGTVTASPLFPAPPQASRSPFSEHGDNYVKIWVVRVRKSGYADLMVNPTTRRSEVCSIY